MSDNHRDNPPRGNNGDQVNIYGGSEIIGIQHNHGPSGDQPPSPEVAALFSQLALLVAQLAADPGVGTEHRRTLAQTLPVLSVPADSERTRWRDTLHLLTNLAHGIGDAATPMLALATQLITLIHG